jgi:hypothetical protein
VGSGLKNRQFVIGNEPILLLRFVSGVGPVHSVAKKGVVTVEEPWTAETIKKALERAEMCRVEAGLVSELKKTELLETALAYERMIERAKRHFRLKDE